jgi:carbon storage regulator
MLILQRKASESLMIGDNIKVSIVEINADRVKISIDAPKNIPIVRTELLDAAASNREATSVTATETIALLQAMKKLPKNK